MLFHQMMKPGNGSFQYDPEVKGIYLNVRSLADSAVQLFLILLPANSP
jgi:hypothetical protein